MPELLVIADVCLCEYTSHGHCGLVCEGEILNDETLPLLAKMSVSLVKAGADVIAPSDMMDGRVAAIREALDENDCKNTMLMAYSAKFASGFTDRSARRHIPCRALATAELTRWIRQTAGKPSGNVCPILRRAQTSLW